MNKPIKPAFTKKQFNEDQVKNDKSVKQSLRVIMTYDIECFKRTKKCGTQIPFAIGLCSAFDLENQTGDYNEFYGHDCVDRFLDHLSDMQFSKGTQIFLYAHNGAKYDLAILNEQILKRSDLRTVKECFIELNGAVISQTVVNQHGVEMIFRDSVRIFQSSLADLCRDMKPKYMKLTEHTFQFDDLTADNVMEDKYRTEISEYLMHDCLSLAEIMMTFREELLLNEKIELDICDCFTSATLAKKLYFSKYYHRYCDKKSNRYIYELNKELDLKLRQSYFGGRCDIYAYGSFEKMYYYDFTSLYPAVGAEFRYPIGDPVHVEGKDIDIEKFYGFIRCNVTTNDAVLPLHGCKFGARLVFGNHTRTEMTLFSEEIKMGLDLGYQYDMIEGWSFDKSFLLRDIMQDGFKLKAQYKAEGKPVLEKTWKLIINSVYGVFGLNWQQKRGVEFMSGEQLNVAIDEHRVHNFNQIGDDDYMVDAERDLVDIKGKSIPIASAVTSYARMKLYSLMNAIQNKGFRVVYSDTDSIITDCNLRQFPDLMLKFMPDGCGNELGSLKNEALDKVSKKLSKADTIRQVSHDDGELYFDECQILAPKVYSLRKKLINGEVIEIAKMKGVKKSSFDEQTQLLNGQVLNKQVTTFESGKHLYMMDQDIEGRVKVVDRTKYISQYPLKKDGSKTADTSKDVKYSKGRVVGQQVFPLTFVEGEPVHNLCDQGQVGQSIIKAFVENFCGSVDSESDCSEFSDEEYEPIRAAVKVNTVQSQPLSIPTPTYCQMCMSGKPGCVSNCIENALKQLDQYKASRSLVITSCDYDDDEYY